MNKDETIDFLHAMWQQHGTKEVLLDGRSCSVGTICLNAIDIIEHDAVCLIQNAQQIIHIDHVDSLE